MTAPATRRRPAIVAGVVVATAFLAGCDTYDIPLTVKSTAADLAAAPCEPTGTGARPPALPATAGGPYQVQSIVDGDTIRISCNGTSTRVRLIGVNAPETVKEDSPVECGGAEASAYLHTALDGQDVFLATDPAQGTMDKYDRLLAYVWDADASLINQAIIENGHAEATGYGKDFAYSDAFTVAADHARATGLGRWSCPS